MWNVAPGLEKFEREVGLSSGSTMRDLAVDYARDLRVVGFYVL